MLWNKADYHNVWIFEMKKSFQFEIQKLHVINKIKCLILEIIENEKLNFIWQKKQKFENDKLNFIWQKKQKFHILLLFVMDSHKEARRHYFLNDFPKFVQNACSKLSK